MSRSTSSAEGPASPPRAGRRERHKLATRARLFESAVQLFATRGYDETSIDDIAELADVARATVFNYFARKDEFVLEWVAGRRERVAPILAAAGDDGSDTAGVLRATLSELAKLNSDDDATSRVMVQVWLRAGGPLLVGATATAELFAETIARGRDRGDIDPTIDPAAAGRLLLDAYLGVLYRWSAEQPGESDLAETLSAVVGMVLEGIQNSTGDRS